MGIVTITPTTRVYIALGCSSIAEHLLYVYKALGSILGTSDVFKRERGPEG